MDWLDLRYSSWPGWCATWKWQVRSSLGPGKLKHAPPMARSILVGHALNMATLLFAPQPLAYARGSVRRRFGAANVRERMRNYLMTFCLAAGKGGAHGGRGA